MNINFEKNNLDLMLDDTRVQWAGDTVWLLSTDGQKQLAMFSADGPVREKIENWCVKNHYRCSAIRDGRIFI